MAKRLLDRQASLISYLTSRGAIFGDGREPAASSLRGIDHSLLGLEARFSFEKRMAKIEAVFTRTMELLSDRRAAILRDFVDAAPPTDISRMTNARQFFDFLSAITPCDPPYLRDVAACELAFATVRATFDEQASPSTQPEAGCADGARFRRERSVQLVRCTYDVRPLLDSDAFASPAKRDTLLAVSAPPSTDQVQALEIAPIVFDVLSILDEWTDPAELGPNAVAFLTELKGFGLVEEHR
jgi:hypothetical protein